MSKVVFKGLPTSDFYFLGVLGDFVETFRGFGVLGSVDGRGDLNPKDPAVLKTGQVLLNDLPGLTQ